MHQFSTATKPVCFSFSCCMHSARKSLMRRHVSRPEMKIECEIFYPIDPDRRLHKEVFICAVCSVRRFNNVMKSENNKYARVRKLYTYIEIN